MARAAAPQAAEASFPAAFDLTIFREMADMSSEAFYLTDADGRFLYVNERGVKMGGYGHEQWLCMHVPDIAPDFPPERFREFAAALSHGPMPPFETRVRRKDGSIFPAEVSVARIVVDGEPYLFGVVRDISESKHLEAIQRSFAQRLLETIEADRERLARELHDA